MNRIPCTECRKRKGIEAELKELKSEHRKLGRKMAHRLNKIADQEDDLKRLRASVAGMRNEAKRVASRQSDLLDGEMPDLADPHTFRLMDSQGVEFHNAREILEVEVKAEDIHHIEEPDDRPDTMPEGGAY